MANSTLSGPNLPCRQGTIDTMSAPLAAHVVLMVNFIPPYALPVFQELSRRVEKLTILASTRMESNRSWNADWGGLDVHIQKTSTWRPSVRHPLRFRERLNVHMPWDTLKKLRHLRPDVIVSNELGMRSFFATLYKIFRGTPLVLSAGLSEHTELGRGRMRFLLRRWLAWQADMVAVNGCSGTRYLQSIGFDPDSIARVPYTHLPGRFNQLPVERHPSAASRLLYVGDLIERKGILPFLAALGQWGEEHPHRNVEFWLVGSGDLADAIAAFSMPQNISVRLLGRRSYDELPELYRQAGILVFPTLSDEWGLVVNEALASGMPVLGSRYSQAVEELCVEGETGWLFRTDKVSEMVAAIDRALTVSPHSLEAMRVSARSCVAEITPHRTADMLVDVIQAAMTKRGKI